MKPGVPARAAARSIVTRVLRSGAYTNLVVRPETRSLPARDAALAQRLAYDTLRNLLRIDRTIESVSSRPLDSIQNDVLDALRVGVNEVLFARTTDHAAVDSTVEVVRSIQPRATGFCNAVLREVARRGEPPIPDDARGTALQVGQPRWIWELLRDAWDPFEAREFLAASQSDAPRVGRLRTGEPPADAVPVPDITGAFVLSNTSPVPDNISIQDGASIAVGLALDPQPGDRILDLAAAPGGKTLHIADRLGSEGLLIASDRNPRRVSGAQRRLAGNPVRWCVADGRRVPFPAGCFDRVLLDAPCSGIGTLRRRPEIRFRVSAAGIDQLSRLQAEMLEEAMRVVKPGGTVVYSVCTVTPQETVNVISDLPTEPIAGLPGRPWGSGWLLGPHLTGTDGMFITRIRR